MRLAPSLVSALSVALVASIALADEAPAQEEAVEGSSAGSIPPSIVNEVQAPSVVNNTVVNNYYYAPPTVVFVPQKSARPPKPQVRPYEDGQYVPAGFHVEERKSTGLIIAGSIVGGLGALGFLSALSMQTSTTYYEGGTTITHPNDGRDALLVIMGAAAIGGFVMLGFGLQEHKVLVEDHPTIAFAAAPTKDGAAFSLAGTF